MQDLRHCWTVVVSAVLVTSVRASCEDEYASCQRWASQGACQQASSFMDTACAQACGRCEPSAVRNSCDPVPDSAGPGAVGHTFTRAVAEFGPLLPTVLSEDPFVITFDNFMSHEEAAAIVAQAESVGFGASGSSCSFKPVCNSSALSCVPVAGNPCWAMATMQALEAKMLHVMDLPRDNCEPLRFFRYREGDTFQRHHDAAGQVLAPHVPGGPRAWTLYVFLSDVKGGGEFRFPRLDLTIPPRAGRAVLWPHLLDADLQTVDERTEHEGSTVTAGVKYGVNLHCHRGNLRRQVLAGCDLSSCGLAAASGCDPQSSEPHSTIQHTFPYEALPGATPLHDLVGLHAGEAVPRLLAAGADPNAMALDGTTALHLAAGRGLTEVMSALLAAGAVASAVDRAGLTALHHAARQGQVSAIKLLVGKVAHHDHDHQTADVEQGRMPAAMQPLHLAARHGQVLAAKALIDAGAAVQAHGGKTWLTPLHLACRHGHVAVARLLLSEGAAADAADRTGSRPLHTAAAEGQSGTVEVLLSAEAVISPRAGPRSITPLQMAAGLGRTAVVRLLLDAGADALEADAGGLTARDYARRGAHAEALRLLEGAAAAASQARDEL